MSSIFTSKDWALDARNFEKTASFSPVLENSNWQPVNTIWKVFEVENQVVIFAFLADMALFDNEINIDLFMYWLSLENYLAKVLS